MAKQKKKHKKPRPINVSSQIPISRIRPITFLGPRHHLRHAREYPILGCWVIEDWEDAGITPVIVARQQEPEKVLFASYLVDLYCLGVKDALAKTDISLRAFQRDLPELCNGEPEPCSVELAHEIIYGAIDYAARYGFQPHPDFKAQLCDQVLDPRDTHPRKNNVKFGKDGKPLYVSGPFDDERRIRSVISTLMRTAGEGNFDYVAALGSEEFFEE